MKVNDLKAEIIRAGLTMGGLANILGISRSALFRKVSGVSEFKQSELQIIKDNLDLDSMKMDLIFFEKKVS